MAPQLSSGRRRGRRLWRRIRGVAALLPHRLSVAPAPAVARHPPAGLAPPFARMRAAAERLAAGFHFVRVDLHALGERLVAGELTHYPTAGNKSFDPPEWDARLGTLWPRNGTRAPARVSE